MNENEKNEISDLLDQLGITPHWQLENIKETTMSRFNVKKSRRKHIKKILDEAFILLSELRN